MDKLFIQKQLLEGRDSITLHGLPPSVPFLASPVSPSFLPPYFSPTGTIPPKGSAKKQPSKSSPAAEDKTSPEMGTAPKATSGRKPNAKNSSKTIAKPKNSPSSTPETDPKPSPTPPATNTLTDSPPEPVPKAEVDGTCASPNVEPDVETAGREPEIPGEIASSKAAAPQTEAADKAGNSQTIESEVQGIAAPSTSPRVESGDKPTPKIKKKIIRRVIVRTRKVPVQKKMPAGENPSPASTNSANPVSAPAIARVLMNFRSLVKRRTGRDSITLIVQRGSDRVREGAKDGKRVGRPRGGKEKRRVKAGRAKNEQSFYIMLREGRSLRMQHLQTKVMRHILAIKLPRISTSREIIPLMRN